MDRRVSSRGRRVVALAVVGAIALAGCQDAEESQDPTTSQYTPVDADPSPGTSTPAPPDEEEDGPTGPITLAFGGDVHFEGGLSGVPDRRGSTLGEMSQALRSADLAMVNLESALTSRGAPTDKELEDASNRYWFRSPPSALGVLDRSGVDVVTVANNHGADYGLAGVRDTLRIARQSPVEVVGVGRDAAAAYTPYRTTIRGTDVAILAADSSLRESADDIWAARPGTGPGLADARFPDVSQLLDAVRLADRVDDVVVVYLHWGEEYATCPSSNQQRLAGRLSEAGADVVVGTHAHELQGAGMLGDTYVSYGLGGLFWYHGLRPETGVLTLTVRDGQVVREGWVPGEIPIDGGGAEVLTGAAGRAGTAGWRALRSCTDLAPGPRPGATSDRQPDPDPEPDPQPDPAPDPQPAALPAYTSTTSRITAAIARRMTSSHDPATCPVPLTRLRYLTMSYVDFAGRARRGEMVVNADVASDVTTAFRRLYAAGFPIQRMRLVDAYGGDDNRSMAANNTSGYNCRTVAGTSTFSDHAYGRAIDINPVQNPYVFGDSVLPPAGRRYVDARRGAGVITADGLVRRTFGGLGWTWGGDYSEPDFQHFAAE